jgi:hypothetical protein
MSNRARFAVVAAMALVPLTLGVGSASADSSAAAPSVPRCPQTPPPPMPPAGQFVRRVDNKDFPLEPGTTYHYRGQEEGDQITDTVSVTDQTKTILGVHATVVFDGVVTNGRPSERTFDWYAQDRRGNVWYMGEDAFAFVHGHWEKSDDSWEAGVDGAHAGIIMEAHSNVGDVYRQEFLQGHAEDMAQVLDLHATVSVPYGTFHHALKTKECTPLEPGVFDVKYYARGVGEVAEATVMGGSAKLVLVSITR